MWILNNFYTMFISIQFNIFHIDKTSNNSGLFFNSRGDG